MWGKVAFTTRILQVSGARKTIVVLPPPLRSAAPCPHLAEQSPCLADRSFLGTVPLTFDATACEWICIHMHNALHNT